MARKAFNFFASYFDVAKELNDKDRLDFYDALILEQFTGIKTDLKGMAKFAYVSQQHSIDSQINGFNERIKRGDTTLEPLSRLPPAIGGKVPPAIQEKEKEKEKDINKKVSFENSNFFDKNIFAEKFKDWNKKKLLYYYDSALSYSQEGNKYVNWGSAINNWAKRDELQGKLKFEDNKLEIKAKTQDEINEQKAREFMSRL
jgi:hypothetical protein